MISTEFSFKDHSGLNIANYKWLPEDGTPIKGLFCILHGVCEHALRYVFLAEALTKEGYICFAQDLRGHGKTMEPGKPGWSGREGWKGDIANIKQLLDIIVLEHPNLPLFIYGHSNGSFFAQDIMQQYGSLLSGVILSATLGKQDLLKISKMIVKLIIAFKGGETTAGLAYNLTIGSFNKPFKKENITNAWLSTKKEIVEQYNADPLCGFRPPNQYFLETSEGLQRIWHPKNEAKIPKDLPIFIIGGSDDSMSNFGKNWRPLIERYKKLGLIKVSFKIYEKARHEVHNDISREEVLLDILSFLGNYSKT